MTNRNLIRCLGLIVRSLQLLSGQSFVGQPVLHPALNGGQRRSLTVHAGRKFFDKLIAEGWVGLGHFSQNMECSGWLI